MHKTWIAFLLFLALLTLPVMVLANHSWSIYHWARTSNPFTLKLGDNLSLSWDSYLTEASADWSNSSVLDTTIVPGNTRPKTCRPTLGQVEVCNARYGSNGWLGIAQIWTTGNHIAQGVVKLNDSYFSLSRYNTPAWKRLVTCQEVGHTLGLDHQDEAWDNTNLGSCMDYTSDPDGPLSNEHPNSHDFEQLETIYSHLDSTSTLSQKITQGLSGALGNLKEEVVPGESPAQWGKALKDNGKVGLYVKELMGGRKIFTFVVWAH